MIHALFTAFAAIYAPLTLAHEDFFPMPDGGS